MSDHQLSAQEGRTARKGSLHPWTRSAGLAMIGGSRGCISVSDWLCLGGVVRSADQSRETPTGTYPAWPGTRMLEARVWDLKNVC